MKLFNVLFSHTASLQLLIRDMVFKVACFEIFGFLIFIKLGNRATVC